MALGDGGSCAFGQRAALDGIGDVVDAQHGDGGREGASEGLMRQNATCCSVISYTHLDGPRSLINIGAVGLRTS